MWHPKISRICFLVWIFAFTGATRCSAEARHQIQRFLNDFCVACHGQDSQEAGLRLDQRDLERWENASLLEDIYSVIENGEMPPEDATKRPSTRLIKATQTRLGERLQTLGEKQQPGMLKRLSRTEYQNTVNDVFGTEFSLMDRLPLDNIEAGFNNNADNLHLSVVDMEAYFAAANRIAANVVGDKPDPKVIIYSTKNTDIDSLSHKDNTDGFAPSLEQASRPLVFASPSIQIKINPSIPKPGTYRIVPHGFYITAEYVRGSRDAEKLPAVRNVTEGDVNDVSLAEHSMSYFLRKNTGVGQSIVTVINKNAEWKEFDPRVGFTTELSSDDTIVLRCNSVKGSGLERMYCIDKATVTGPVYKEWPPSTPFYKEYCEDIDASSNEEACREILKRLAEKLFRRPVPDTDMQQVYSHAKKEFAQGRGIYSGLQAGIRGMLCSANFLFKQEGVTNSLDDHAIAARMSYFLWNSLPDDELFDLASQGKLKDPLIRCEQTMRMLQDPRAGRFAKDYVHQWLDLKKLEVIEPDLSIFAVDEFDLVRDQIKEEPVEFFKEVLKSNLSLLNFIDSDFVMITPELNYIYRIDGLTVAKPSERPGATKISPTDYRPKQITSEFSKVPLDGKYPYRGGLLSQAGFMLMTTNNGQYTNPFYRGAWILKSFYGDHLETPEGLEIGALSPPTQTETIKETIDAHRENISCNSCHRKMDPFGISLENFDVIGRWRDAYSNTDNYTATDDENNNNPERLLVDARTVHSDGRAFEGPEGLKKILLEDRDKFSRTFLENILSYSMARQLTFRDRGNLDSLYKQAADTNFRLRDIILMIISSENFTQR